MFGLSYEKLSLEDKVRVPVTSYKQARRLVGDDNESKITVGVKKAESKTI